MNKRADRMTNNWRRAMAAAVAAAAAARQGHVAQNNYGNGNDNDNKVWACWAQPFVVTADSPGLLTPCLNAVCACVCEIHFSMSVTKTDKCPHSVSLLLSSQPLSTLLPTHSALQVTFFMCLVLIVAPFNLWHTWRHKTFSSAATIYSPWRDDQFGPGKRLAARQ